MNSLKLKVLFYQDTIIDQSPNISRNDISKVEQCKNKTFMDLQTIPYVMYMEVYIFQG